MSKLLVYSAKLLSVEDGHVISIFGKTKKFADYFEIVLGPDEIKSENLEGVELDAIIKFEKIEESDKKTLTVLEIKGHDESKQTFVANSSANSIVQGDIFKFSIYITLGSFIIFLDGTPYCTLSNCKSFNINRISIFGDVEQLYEVNHAVAVPKFENFSKRKFSGTLPMLKPETAIVFIGKFHGTIDGYVEFEVLDTLARTSIMIVVNFESQEFVVKMCDHSQDCQTEEKTVKPEKFPLELNEDFKLALGITKRGLVITCNGEHIADYPVEGNIYHSNQAQFIVMSYKKLEVDIQGVDSLVMKTPKLGSFGLSQLKYESSHFVSWLKMFITK
ncbi:CLUMA_CG002611, isoform A [Clunio marinus]|uniref:CLUMA_CG002611, isoform A n=1 Tax=Clunio marinus TaxID=568069 RepID=A0A1J1HQV4_9DIPT|nr:CLUMA_CG002611, isoform A [Clunio marinus]